ncbi:TIGR04211 family SH3 domain-containing protein [Spongiibacter taiwanensis]|uniref:TIGR04211 family SH3 domain-containing protein n=1 Tax=Spongiibacter taiwanensis TaxID=1748242 RepID=UPI002034FC55|nr:TIGR04211 family SH3 domain-containing protein [Spongiibacter taiwanensis]USA43232.1 TIGR04211 family SH3 domain-containing protein [Spongiibacter taiwanensis]
MNKLFLFGLLLLCGVSGAVAETRYISDKVYVPLRSGDSSRHRIVHRGLPSGEKVELLQSNEESGYSEVRTGGGIEGWLPSHYLVESPVARTLLERANAKIKELDSDNKALKEKLTNTGQVSTEAQSDLDAAIAENTALKAELEEIKRISGNSIKLDEDNRQLLQANQALSNEVDVLKTDNARLRENKENEFFLNGAFAVLIGVMVTLIIPRLMPKKRSEWR